MKEKEHEIQNKMTKNQEDKLVQMKRELNMKAVFERAKMKEEMNISLSKSLPKLEVIDQTIIKKRESSAINFKR